MKLLALIMLLGLGLAGCAGQTPKPEVGVPAVIRTTKLKVVKPPAEYYNCPVLRQLPDPETLTDIETARMLTTLYGNNVKCRNSIDAIRRYLDEAERRLSS